MNQPNVGDSSASPASSVTGERKKLRLAVLLTGLIVLTALWRITKGEWNIPLSRVFQLLNPFSDVSGSSAEALVVRCVRLPRFFAALGTGGLLAVSGAVLQGLLGNPLAEPYTLGIASGAAFGGAVGFFISKAAVTPCAFLGAMTALFMVALIAKRSGGGEYLVLSGIITSSVLSAGVTFLKAVADDKLGAIVLWLMGSFSGATPRGALSVWFGALAVSVPALIWGRQLDAVSLGSGQGEMLGINESRLRFRLLAASSLATALAVSHFGIIGFVGLVAPHMMRLLIGPLHRPLLCFSFLAGGLLLAAADGLAQYMGELPIGVITALAGGPFFCHILMRRKR